MIISDAGPLITLAKLDVLPLAFQLYPSINIAPAVYEETVTEGLRIKAPDAMAIRTFCEQGKIQVQKLQPTRTLWKPAIDLQKGERETLLLAIQTSATTLLIDDWNARQEAEKMLHRFDLATTLKGTLGVLVEMYRNKILESASLKNLLETMTARKDIWVSPRLCAAVLQALLNSEL